MNVASAIEGTKVIKVVWWFWNETAAFLHKGQTDRSSSTDALKQLFPLDLLGNRGKLCKRHFND